jgi:hypothetical protein
MHSSSFFPSPQPDEEPERFASPPWFQPPEDEYPLRVPVREFLARSDRTSVSVSHVDVFSTGILIASEWDVRRVDEPQREWQVALQMGSFYGHGADPESMLRFGLALADGTVVTTLDRMNVRDAFTTAPKGWSLMERGGGGGGGDSHYNGTSGLWLWPLPPAGPIELVAEWRERSIPESRIVLDGTAILAAVQRVRSLWD